MPWCKRAGAFCFAVSWWTEEIKMENVSRREFAGLVPALLALAESKTVSGRDFILAAVCGYEAGCAV